MIGGLVWFSLAMGADPTALQRTLTEHAERRAWPAVDDVYRRLLVEQRPTSARDHVLGAHAALHAGQALEAWQRLQRVTTADHEAEQLRATLQQRYGFVSLVVPDGQVPELFRSSMPFVKQERDVVRHAIDAVRTERAYRGLLPAGVYALGGLRFEVEPDWPQWKVVVAGDATTGDPVGTLPDVIEIPPP